MKKIKIFLIFSVVTLFSFSSCEDAYNIKQDGELNESSIKTIPDLQSYLNAGVYASVSIADQIGFTGIFTDETGVGRGSGGQNLITHRFIINSSDPFADAIWSGNYQTINRVNRVLRIAKNNIPTPTDPNDVITLNSIIGQAKALRAFSYLQLETYFSTDMKDDNALGVMFLGDDVPTVADAYPRVNNSVIFSQMVSDLDFAYTNIVDPTGPTAYKFVSKQMIDAFRARFYLYRGNYTLAKQYAQSVISTSGLNLTTALPVPTAAPVNGNAGSSAWNTSFYGASSTNPYRKMWASDATSYQGEIIFALSRPNSGSWENVASQFTTNSTNAAGSPLFEVSRSLFNLLRSTSGDVRRYANVDPTSIINPNYNQPGVDYISTDVIVIDKYPGQTGQVLRNDLKVFRLSEMYFILAECLANEGNINGSSNSVAAIIKKIRDARNFLNTNQPLPSYVDATAALKDILFERRLELCFEAHRYIDLKRLGPLTGQSIDRDATDDQIVNVLTIPNNDYRFTLPIPISEINFNPSIVQNPGY